MASRFISVKPKTANTVQETPALYELKDGKGSLINFDFNGGLYTVPKQLEHGYLAIGKQKVEFHREGGAK